MGCGLTHSPNDMACNHIEAEIKSFMDKSFSKRHHNTVYTTLALAGVIFLAAWGGHSVADVAEEPSPDTVFYRMETTLECLNKVYRHFVEKVLHQNRGYFERHTPYLLIDETHESYTGKLLQKKWKSLSEKEQCKYIHGYKQKAGDTGSFRFLTFALVGPTKKLIVRSIPVIADDGKPSPDGKRHPEDTVPQIIETIQWLRKHAAFRLVIMDRGYYNQDLIRAMNQLKIPYLIRARISETMQSMIAGMTTEWTAIEYFVGESSSDNGERTTLVIGKDQTDEWALVTNRLPLQAWRLRQYYKKRWNIENIFQVCDGINVHTNSTEIEKKLFCFLVSCLIYNLWQFSREKRQGMTLRKFTRKTMRRIEEIVHEKDPPPTAHKKQVLSNNSASHQHLISTAREYCAQATKKSQNEITSSEKIQENMGENGKN